MGSGQSEAVRRMGATAGELVGTGETEAMGREVLEPFGEDESYWTVYRLFTVPKNRGVFFTLDQISEHLAGSYDMSAETRASVVATLQEWKDFIEKDAAMNGIEGEFRGNSRGFVFMTRERLSPIQEVTEADTSEQSGSYTPERNTFVGRLELVVKTLLDKNDDGAEKQAVIKKLILKANPLLSENQLQQEIDTLVNRGDIFKFRRGSPAYLSLTARSDDGRPEQAASAESEDDGAIDLKLAANVLEVLCAPRRSYQKKITMKELWREIMGDTHKSLRIPPEDLVDLKSVCRQLEKKGLLTTGGARMGTGGALRLRSRDLYVLKVGLTSQDMKKELKRISDEAGMEFYLQQLFEQEGGGE